MRTIIVTIIICTIPFLLKAQNDWVVPQESIDKISPFVFDGDLVKSGEVIYQSSCMTCHGTPTENNPVVFVPSPGDPASDKFQNQSDGSLYYKIVEGRGGMPAFKSTLAEEEIWGLVAYFRSFNKDYVQPEFDYGDEVLADLKINTGYDENTDKLVVKVATDGMFTEGTEVSAWVIGMFGKFPLGVEDTNEAGIAYFDVDATLPGDEQGNLTVQVRAAKGYAVEKITETMQLVNPTVKTDLLEGRHLWSTALRAPWWLIIVFNLIVVGIWGIMIYVLIGLLRLKKVS